jgi:hypothetical protein
MNYPGVQAGAGSLPWMGWKQSPCMAPPLEDAGFCHNVVRNAS